MKNCDLALTASDFRSMDRIEIEQSIERLLTALSKGIATGIAGGLIETRDGRTYIVVGVGGHVCLDHLRHISDLLFGLRCYHFQIYINREYFESVCYGGGNSDECCAKGLARMWCMSGGRDRKYVIEAAFNSPDYSRQADPSAHPAGASTPLFDD